jgi:CRP-like cAMP-binding protein
VTESVTAVSRVDALAAQLSAAFPPVGVVTPSHDETSTGIHALPFKRKRGQYTLESTSNLPAARSLWSPQAWEALRPLGFSQIYPPAVSFFEQGSPVEAVGIVEEGLVKLLRWEHRGEAVSVGIRFAGGPLGTAAAILRAPHAVTAETLTRCRILSIPVEQFLQVVTIDAQLSSDLHRIHAQELIGYVAHLGTLCALSTRDRLLRLIGEVVAAEDHSAAAGPLRVALPLRYTELARTIVTTRQHLSRVLKRLEDDNLIRRDKGWLLIPDPSRFWAAINKQP